MGALPSRRTLRVLDVAVAAWVAVCVGLGFWFAAEIRDLRSLPETLATAGEGLQNTGEALESVPAALAGEDVQQLARDARESGRQAQASAADGRAGLDTLSVLTGATLALVPTGAVLLFYVPLRVAAGRRGRRERG